MNPARARRALGLAAAALALCCYDGSQPPGTIEGGRRPLPAAAAEPGAKRILFGDLHVHTTYSIDAFVYALPFFGGAVGTHPPADACDFARYCSQLDFFSLTDHAEGLLPENWRRSKESLRQCNALAGDASDPDLVAFAGFEWTQVGSTPETHYGHKNVIFPGLAEQELPARPITSLDQGIGERARLLWLVRALEQLGHVGLDEYADFLWLLRHVAELPDCEPGVETRRLPPDCRENAPTPEELFEKLSQWGFPTLVIPHGLAWGVHAPPGARLDNQLSAARHRPDVQRLLEVYSGHGNSEEYRPLPEGTGSCPEPTADYLPCCWRAGEIMRARCGDLPEAECEARVLEARRLALEAGVSPHQVFPDTREEDWLDCDQCRNCFKPAFNLRPGETAQYSLALSRSGLRFRWGFVGSSDDHKGHPGTGYKQLARKWMSDARGVGSEWLDRRTRPYIAGRQQDPRRGEPVVDEPRSLGSLFDTERGASFLHPGGLVAVHASGRDRRSIWDALMRREVYGTSGPRLLLWFELKNAPGGPLPMGGEARIAETPRFEVRALGDFVQQAGCPQQLTRGISAERLEALCLGECYHPGDARHPVVAIEVVRVRPQQTPDEDVSRLIEDPWRRFECPPDPGGAAGCAVAFEDPEFPGSGRDAVYYVRALQEPTPAVNGANYRTEFDAAGNAVRTTPCYGDYRTPADDDCLAPVQERAWSSPIFLDRAEPAQPSPP